jgi:hypothetical protein
MPAVGSPLRAQEIEVVQKNGFWDLAMPLEAEARPRSLSDSAIDYSIPMTKDAKDDDARSHISEAETASPAWSDISDLDSECQWEVASCISEQAEAVPQPPGTWGQPGSVPLVQAQVPTMPMMWAMTPQQAAQAKLAVALQARKAALGGAVSELAAAAMQAAERAERAEKRSQRCKAFRKAK